MWIFVVFGDHADISQETVDTYQSYLGLREGRQMSYFFSKPTHVSKSNLANNQADKQKLSILFVCAGNVCRSPACQSVMEHFIAQNGLVDHISVDSAGIFDDRNGEKADRRMRWAAFAKGYSISGRSRRVSRTDLDRFDFVIALDQTILCTEHFCIRLVLQRRQIN